MATPATTIQALEDALIGALEPAAPDGVRVESFPNDPSTYRLTTQGTLLVLLQDENYRTETDEGIGLLSVKREPLFNVVAVAKQRRTADRRQGQQAAYDLIETALGALAGFETGAYKTIPVETQALGLNPRDKSWRYQVSFRLISNETLGLAT